MNQTRFREGRLTTGYIAEEFPDGFSGVELDAQTMTELAAFCAVAVHRVEARGFADLPKSDMAPPLHQRTVVCGETKWSFDISEREEDVFALYYQAGRSIVETHWLPGDRVAVMVVDGVRHTLKTDRITAGMRLRYRGADITMKVLPTAIAHLTDLMPVKLPPDMSKYLLCPMPGQVVRIDVGEGDMVEDGQALAIVEAMKMENVLRANKRARVSKIHAEPGAVLAVDAVIMEFDDV